MTRANRRTCRMWSTKKRSDIEMGNCEECGSALLKYENGGYICSKCGLIQGFHRDR